MNINAIAIDSSKIFVGTSTGVFLSINNGSNWTDVSKGLAYGLDVYALGARGNYIFAAGGSGGVFRSSDNGTSWTAVNSGMYNGYVNYMAVYDTTIFVDAGQGSFYTSTNDGTNWNYYSYTNDLLSTLGFVVHSTTKGTSIFVGSNGGLFRSTDNCTSWTRVGFMDTTIRGFAFSDTNFFAGTAVGAFLSTNNGASWTEIGLKNIYVGAFVVSPNDTGGTNIIAGTSNGIYLSSNNGTNWVQVKSGINIASLAFSGKNIFASTWSDGIFLSTNNGATWAAFNTGLTNDPNCVPALAVSGTNIYAGVTNGGGVWRRPLSETVSVDKLSTDLPTHFSLDQNYPNPFNPATTISFTLPSKSFVSLKVFDILGREVATIISEEMSAGSYSRQWNAANMSSGIYFYRLQAGTFIETKKLVLLR
ncbi:MAG: T9SS type A sorting domain-containing protein [Bacteroidota bacterium]